MEIHGKILAFCVLHSIISAGTSAFVVRPPTTFVRPSVALQSSPFQKDVYAKVRVGGPQATPSGALSAAASTSKPPTTKKQKPPPPMSPSKIWNSSALVRVEGNSLRTWDVNPSIDAMQVLMKSGGRPIIAKVELWHGPDYTPSKLGVYIEDGDLRPFNAVVATPGCGNTIALYNTAAQEYPFTACVYGNMEDSSALLEGPKALSQQSNARTVQGGGMVTTYPFDASVQSIQILLKTDGRNLNARVELLQGPNTNKQVMEFYSSDGKKRPFSAIVECPGNGNMIRIVNQNTVEYPFTASVEPYLIETGRFQGRPMP